MHTYCPHCMHILWLKLLLYVLPWTLISESKHFTSNKFSYFVDTVITFNLINNCKTVSLGWYEYCTCMFIEETEYFPCNLNLTYWMTLNIFLFVYNFLKYICKTFLTLNWSWSNNILVTFLGLYWNHDVDHRLY